jgi:hypothetical protein
MTTERSTRSITAVRGDSTSLELQETEAKIFALGLPPSRFLPRRYKPRNVGEWTGHLGFASDLIVATQPELIVELGTHWGEAYFTFCQTVEEHGLSSLCYAVDHWLGDEHAGRYGEEVFDEVKRYNDRYYKHFSYLLRTGFDDAVSQFGDGSIGLLHIDGLHTYEAVSHDFRTWLPKVKPGGIILLHDICVRHLDFGVWRLWEEIKDEFPSTFEFHHSWGLGLVRKEGEAASPPLMECLFNSFPAVCEEVRRHYVVYASHLEHLLGHIPDDVASLVKAAQADAMQEATAARLERDTAAVELGRAMAELAHVKTELGLAEDGLRREQTTRIAMQQSLSWRVTEPVRRLMTALRSGPRKTA